MKSKEISIVVILFILVIGFSYFYNLDRNINNESGSSGINFVCFDNVNCIEVEIVDNSEERQKGLMFRENLDRDKGMLFIFDSSGVYPFWMKNTLIPLDIIWIDSEGRVVFINKDTQPCVSDPCQNYNPGLEALYVLEINAGVSEEVGIEVGSSINFK